MSDLQSVGTLAERILRRAEFAAQDQDDAADEEKARRANRNFAQVYPKGWKRLQMLIRTNPPAARLYAFLGEHMDESSGAVVVSQEVLAQEIGVHERTIRRLSDILEKSGAIVKIRVGTGVIAYCLDPEEIWKSWDDKKQYAAFTTKTLVLKSDKVNNQIRRKLKMMMGEGGN